MTYYSDIDIIVVGNIIDIIIILCIILLVANEEAKYRG